MVSNHMCNFKNADTTVVSIAYMHILNQGNIFGSAIKESVDILGRKLDCCILSCISRDSLKALENA